MTLAQRLDQLVEAIEQNGLSIQRCVQPGLDEVTIANHLAPLNVSVPADLQALYQWGNGTVELCDVSLFDEHDFLSIHDALYEYNQLVSVHQTNQAIFGIDFTKCFPFASFMGSSYVVYCDEKPLHGLQYPVIRIFQGVDLCFLNIEAMIITLTEWYQSGAYRLKTLNEPLKLQIWHRINPGLPASV